MIPALLLGAAQMGLSWWEQQQQSKANTQLAGQISSSISDLEGTRGGIEAGFDAQNVLAGEEFKTQTSMFTGQMADQYEQFKKSSDFNVGKTNLAGSGTAKDTTEQGSGILRDKFTSGTFDLRSNLFEKQKTIASQKMGALSGLDEQIKRLEAQKAGLITEGGGGFAATLSAGLGVAGLVFGGKGTVGS